MNEEKLGQCNSNAHVERKQKTVAYVIAASGVSGGVFAVFQFFEWFYHHAFPVYQSLLK